MSGGAMPMRLEDYWQLVRRRWRVVAIGAVVGAFLGALVPQLIPTKYQATMKLIVQAPYASRNPTEAYDANLLTTELASAYAGLLTDGSMAEQVIAERGPRLPAGELQSMIDAKAVAGTNLINVTVTDTSAERAKLVADSLEPAFQRRLAQLDSTSNRAYTPTVRLVEPATLPRTPVTPQAPRTALFGGILGALLAFGGVIVRQRTDKTIKDAEEVAALAELPTVRTVVSSRTATRRPLRVEAESSAPFWEQMRQVRNSILLAADRVPPTSILVTSAMPGEGRTTIACALAQVLAEGNRSVVLVDGDLRRPSVLNVVGGTSGTTTRGDQGLADVLRGEATLADAVHQLPGRRLDVLASEAGTTNPGELLSLPVATSVVTDLSAAYDFVVIDGPALLPVADSVQLGQMVDGVLLAVRCGRSRWDAVQRSLELLEATAAPLLGAVVTLAGRRDWFGQVSGQAAHLMDPRARVQSAQRLSGST